MSKYRITYINIAFAPRASQFCVEADSVNGAVDVFHERINKACVVQTIGTQGIVSVECVNEGGGDHAE